MQYTTSAALCATVRVLPRRIHALAVLCFAVLALLGHPLEVSAGWRVWPPVVYVTQATARRWTEVAGPPITSVRAARLWAGRTWPVPLCRSLLVQIVWWTSGHSGPAVGALLPWLAWVWPLAGLLWPYLERQPEWGLVRGLLSRVMQSPLWLFMGLALSQAAEAMLPPSVGGHLLLVGGLVSPATVTVYHDKERGCYTAELNGRFTLTMADDDPFRLRIFVLSLRSLDDRAPRGSRRTRDGRTPAVRQEMLAESLGIPQPDISRWERYAHDRDWRRLLSLHSPDILTYELQEQIIETWAHWPQWSSEQVYHILIEQGVAVTQSQVGQVAHESGWQIVRQTLRRLCAEQAETLRLREGWLVGDLLAQNQMLLAKVAAKEALTQQEMLDVVAWREAAAAAGLQPRLPRAVQPWLRRVEQVLFHPWDETMAGDVCCTYCGSTDVGRKSRIPRLKRVIDEAGEVQWVAVYRYYCKNLACEKKSFTAFPPACCRTRPSDWRRMSWRCRCTSGGAVSTGARVRPWGSQR